MEPTARFTELVQGPEERLPLDEAALLIAAHAEPGLDVAAELRALDDLAAGVAEPTLDAWRHHLFVELGFSGDVGSYYDPANSFLNEVVRRRVGLPITLSVLGMEVGRRVGLRLQGVGMPGHFLLRPQGPQTRSEGRSGPQTRSEGRSGPQPRSEGRSGPQPRSEGRSGPQPRSEGRSGPQPRSEGRSGPQPRSEGRSGPGTEVYVDPFDAGRELDRAGCVERFRAVNGTGTPFQPEFLDPVGPLAILSRMLNNLKSIYAARGQVAGLEWVLRLRVVLPGSPPVERRDWARVLGAGGRFVEAATELENLVDVLPEEEESLLGEAFAFWARLN